MAEYVIVLTNAFTKFTFPVQQVTSPPAPWSKPWYVIGSLFMVFIKWCGDSAAPMALRNKEFPQLFWRKWVMLPHSPWSAMHSSFWQGATLALCIPCDAPYLYRVFCLLPIMFGIDPKLDHFIHLFLIMSERTNQAPVVNGFPYTRTVCPVLTSNLRTSFKKRLVSANSSLTAPNQHPYWWESLDS